MAKLFSVDTDSVKSFKLVERYVSFGDWLKTKYKVQQANEQMFSSLCRGQETGKKGSEIVLLIKEEAKEKLKRYYTDSLGPALDPQRNQASFEELIDDNMGDAVDKLKNYTKNTVTRMSATTKSNVVTNVCTWGKVIAEKYVDWAVHQEIAALQVPEKPTPHDLTKCKGVGCAVYVDGVQCGSMKVAPFGTEVYNHAEMQWKNAHGEALVDALHAGVRVDFHITEQPCAAYCAGELITWWQANGHQTGANCWIYTYKDTDGRAHVYALTKDAILRVGSW